MVKKCLLTSSERKAGNKTEKEKEKEWERIPFGSLSSVLHQFFPLLQRSRPPSNKALFFRKQLLQLGLT